MTHVGGHVGGHPKEALEEEVAHLRPLLLKAMRELKAANDALSVVHERCTSLLLENRELKKRMLASGVTLRGWTCSNTDCKAFNGSEKELLAFCRCCGDARPRVDMGSDAKTP